MITAPDWMVFVASLVLKGTVLLAATLVLARVLVRSSAATRHLAWTAGMIGLLVLPFVAAVLPWRLPVLPRMTLSAATAASDGSSAELRDPGPLRAAPTPVVEAAPAGTPDAARRDYATDAAPRGPIVSAPDLVGTMPDGRTLLALAPILWAMGALVVFGRLGLGSFMLARSARRARPAAGPRWAAAIAHATRRLELDRPVPVLMSDDVTMPFVAGLLRPRVILPADAEGWTNERRRAVLAHELAHVRRGDLVPHFLAWLACGLWWFHPMVWVAARRLRAESERACDDLVLGLGTRASDYAQHLLQIVTSVRVERRVPAAVLPLARRSEFEGRMLAILEPGTRRGGISRVGAAGALCAIAVLAIPLAAVVPVPPMIPDAAGRLVPIADPSIERGGAAAVRSRLLEDGTAEAQSDAKDKYDSEYTYDYDVDLDGLTFAASKHASASASASSSASGDTGRASSAVIAGLARSLSDARVATRTSAATALGELDDPRAVAALSRALREDTDAGVRKAAAWALGEIEDPAGVPALSDALRQDRDVAVRRMAVWALGEIESPDAVPALSAALRDQDVEMRRNAAWALGEIEDASAVPALATALREDRDAEVRHTAVWALGEIEDASAIPALAVALRDQDVEMRRKAAWALGEIESPQAVEALSAAVRDSDYEVRKTAVWALGEIESPAAVPALSNALRDADPEIRKTAAWALAEIDTPAAYEALVPLLESDDPELRRLAVEAIAHQ